MNIPGLDLCPTGEDDIEPPFELVSFKGTIRIPRSQMNGACRPITDFKKIGSLKITSTWIMRECFDSRKKERVCIMKYKDSTGTEDDLENNLVIIRREIEILSAVKHDNIIQFYEPAVGAALENVHLVFEFAQYFLSDLIAKNVTGLYQKPMIKNVMRQLLQGIEYLHRNLIMHRDISPLNILFNKDGFLKLANFHNARKLGSKDLKLEVMCKNYQAVEIIMEAKHHGSAVDIWATGCMFAELLIKKKIFDAVEIEKIYEKILNVLGLPYNIWKEYPSLPGLQKFHIGNGHQFNFVRKILAKSNLSTEDSIEMIRHMLIYDPALRITAEQALKHPYFIDESPIAYSEEKVAELLKLSGMIQ